MPNSHEAADLAMANAMWRAEQAGTETPYKDIGNFLEEYVSLSQRLRTWLRKEGFDVTKLPYDLYNDYYNHGG